MDRYENYKEDFANNNSTNKNMIGIIKHFDGQYDIYQQNKKKATPNDDKDSYTDSSDDGFDSDIMDVLNKELDYFNVKRLNKQTKDDGNKKKISDDKAMKNNRSIKKRLKSLSIIISKNEDLKIKKDSKIKEANLVTMFKKLIVSKENKNS